MQLLFRSPLLQFDITDPCEVKKHWPILLECIRLSSQDLFEKIQRKQPEDLTKKEKMAVYRYLLRGKYRPTPFGNWAGVGVASWTQTVTPGRKSDALTTMSIPIPEPSNQVQDYWINPSLMPWGDGWKFWNFDRKNEKWRYSKSENNLLIQRLRSLAYEGQPIKQEELYAPFSELIQDEKQQIWKHLIANQLLVCSPSPPHLYSGKQVNRFILQTPDVSISYKHKLEKLFSEIGELAVSAVTPYMQSFKEKFIAEFDDRFVPIKMLWKLVSRLDPDYGKSEGRNTYQKQTPLFEMDKQAIVDLQNTKLHYGNRDAVRHVQGLFRILENGQLLLDNLVFNRPFVYGGRFTYQQEVYDYFRNQAVQEEALIADVHLMEGQKATHISAHKNIATVQINCFSGSTGPNELDSSDTYIGLIDGKFHLAAPAWGKFIIPVFQHPLNPQFITHPICRMLWEVAHQDFVRPSYYSPGYFAENIFTPQLNWGDIILQPGQWNLKWEDSFLNQNKFMEVLSKKGIPKKILVGFQDQELGLDLDCVADLSVLHEEIRKKRTIRIQEWLWSSEKCHGAEQKANLQFLWGMHLTGLKEDLPNIHSLNYISEQDNKEWVSVRIILVADYQQTLVMRQMILLAEEFKQFANTPYHYLFYRIQNAEIRLRVRTVNPQERADILSLIFSTFQKIPDIDHVKLHPYYPEKTKYSEVGMHISENLFYYESELLLKLNPISNDEKLSIAVGIGTMFLQKTGQVDYWIAYFRELTGTKVAHRSAKSYLLKFKELTSMEWRNYYWFLARRHPWYKDPEKRSKLIGNHIHMLINRVFWEAGMVMEAQVNALLYSYIRERKYGKKKSN
ncbi:lantibiotic dehydratase [Algoriphagus sp. C2-6-M1]|uniref:lantibiotic dehydratase n=1 Tax=Algoriphagus persicinus TaxID=3108754 RepID=UPI002B3B93D9|nr:lantibiotic dehydratase [Algoriphagus sp. C2-6-M1]MEB2782670.1 lantibiotic dehydratase [Algoriphagus sp. C2-6-M1]